MKKYVVILLIIAMVATFAGCGTEKTEGNGGGTTGETATELVFTSPDWVEGIDLCQAEWWPDFEALTSDPLFIREADGTLSPCISTEYSVSDDGMTIRMTIADDLKYHDGTPVEPKDVKRSIEWAREKSIYASDFAMLDSIDVEGNDVILNLSSFSPSIIFYMSHNCWPTIKASDIDTMTPEELRWKATSYGPYYVDEYVSGSHVVLKRNEYYKTYNKHVKNKGVEPVETIRVRFTTDPFAISQGMIANEIDMSYDIDASNMEDLLKNPSLKTEWTATNAIFRMYINPKDPIFSDAKVRQGFSLLVDREKLAEYSDGTFDSAYAFSMEGMLDNDSAIGEYYKKTYCNDTQKGLDLLKESGWTDSNQDGILDKEGKDFIVKVMYGDDTQKKIAELMQVLLKEVGVQIEGEMVDAGTFYNSVQAGGDYQTALGSFAWGDTSTTLPYVVKDESIFDIQKYLDGCASAMTITDSNKRIEAFADLQKQIFETGCILPLVSANAIISYNTDKINNLFFDENGLIYLNDIQ